MLIALLDDSARRSDSIVSNILTGAAVDTSALREALLGSLRESESATVDVAGSLPFSGGAKKALELGLREALSLGHNYIGCEHLLLAILRSADGPLEATLATSNLAYGTAREVVRLSTPDASRRRRFGGGRRGGFGMGARMTNAAQDAIARAVTRADNRAVTTGDLLVALREGQGTHFAKLNAGVSLPDAATLASKADALIEAKDPDGVVDQFRVDPKSGAVTVTDPDLAEVLKDLLGKGEIDADTLRTAVREALQRRLRDDEE
jgi:ATP-dependent Clp protease ATP-binding subunit ClpA